MRAPKRFGKKSRAAKPGKRARCPISYLLQLLRWHVCCPWRRAENVLVDRDRVWNVEGLDEAVEVGLGVDLLAEAAEPLVAAAHLAGLK